MTSRTQATQILAYSQTQKKQRLHMWTRVQDRRRPALDCRSRRAQLLARAHKLSLLSLSLSLSLSPILALSRSLSLAVSRSISRARSLPLLTLRTPRLLPLFQVTDLWDKSVLSVSSVASPTADSRERGVQDQAAGPSWFGLDICVKR